MQRGNPPCDGADLRLVFTFGDWMHSSLGKFLEDKYPMLWIFSLSKRCHSLVDGDVDCQRSLHRLGRLKPSSRV